MNEKLTRREALARAGLLVGATTLALPLRSGAAEHTAAPPRGEFSYSLNTATIRGQKLTLPEQIAVAAQAGYDCIEPWTADIVKFAAGGGSLRELRQRCADGNLRVIDAIGFATWMVDDEQQRTKGLEQLKHEMDLVAQLGGTHIAAPPAGAYKEPKLKLDDVAERYRAILEFGREFGVVPQLEFWGGSANLNHVAQAAYVAAKAGHPDACILADVFHLYKGGTAPATMRLLGRSAVHVLHMNDYPAQPRETVKDSDRVWPGDGVAPIREILGHLAFNGCRVALSVEVFNADYWKLPALDAAKTGLAKMKAAVAGMEAQI